MSELLKETLELDVDESNELLFKVVIEGANEPAKVRLVCEGQDDVCFMFKGYLTEQKDVVQFNIPEMKNKLKEGTYSSRVEVLVGSKFFTPVEFDINFKKQVTVVAEAIVKKKPVEQKPQEVTVSAIPVIVSKSGGALKAKFEQKKNTK